MGRLILPAGSRAYLDTVSVIYTVEGNPTYWSVLNDLWLARRSGEIDLVTSELTLLETLVRPLRDNNSELRLAYEHLLTGSDFGLVQISASILRVGAQYRATQNLKTPDAIHAATASISGCSHFVTNDPVFRRLENIVVIILSDLI
ncbi:MAG: type II toxin-antitoxin system VapC family toxin [Pyrinomonadaceae bacterium]